jgi:hypothetical protein
MSFIHHLYLGYFEHDGSTVRFSNTVSDPILKPVVSRPLDMAVIKQLVQVHMGENVATHESLLPSEWGIWIEDGYFACDQGKLTHEGIDFIVCLAQEAGCQLVDFNSRSLISLAEFLRGLGTARQSVAGR